jgi:hypothetical protein
MSLFQAAGAHPGEGFSKRIARERRPACAELTGRAVHRLDEVFVKGHLYRFHESQ